MNDSLDTAIRRNEAHLRTDPDDATALHNLSVLYAQADKLEKALETARKVVAASPSLAEGWLNLGNLETQSNRLEAAHGAFQTASQLAPDDPRTWYNLGNILARLDRRRDAIDSFEKAHTIAPTNTAVLASLALAYRKHGRPDDAVRVYADALKIDPNNARLHSNLLVALQYTQTITPETLAEAHRAWSQHHQASSSHFFSTLSASKRPLRVGYVSGDFRQHPVGWFLSGVLAHHDRTVVTPVCFSDTRTPDHMTMNIRSHAAEWHETAGQNDTHFGETVRGLGIDILIDLAGHFDNSRLVAFSHRLAPVQVTWAGYVGTTGLTQMDWLIADDHHAPPTYDSLSSEKIARMPDDYVCYTPPDYAPDVGDLPALSNGFITFGCFNNLVKVNDGVLALWGKILSAVPGSRLVLQCADLSQPDLKERVWANLADAGVDRGRVDLREKLSHADLLATYNEVDIALDPFPYSGGLTTLEALWMGVPVLTKTGHTFAGRHSTAHLSVVGLADWVAADSDSYFSLACQKASDLSALQILRQGIRSKMAQSAVCDGAGFTAALEQQFQMMWASACSQT